MDKRELQELLSQSYKQENWKKIVQFVFPNVSILSTPKEFPISNDKIKKFRQLGNVRLNDGKNLALFELLLADTVNIQRNRVELNNEISKYIDQEQIHGVLSVFEQGTDDYRFTFSARSTEFDEQESDFVQKKTDTKRYTYVLGKNESCKTPAERFFKLSEKKSEVDINAIQNAFSVEQLSKEFFEKYKKQFEKFWKFIHTNETYNNISFGTDREKGIRDFTKKLLGRIVFLHFLQKKGWMGCTAGIKEWEDGDKQFMQTLFESYSDQSTFHSKCLAELFYNTLNKRRTDDLFVCDGLEGVLSKSKVPYLNGGLFDSDENITRKINFPASYFQELFDFFGQYNFTIDENDPNDHEVGIDPEMLGHIFENLLEDNKDKGAFYTPKVVVQYMCQESIIEYINTKINEKEDSEIKSAIEDLIRNKLAEKCSDLDLVQPISKALFEVKICDPAIGSGAFPMGILNVIYSAIEELYFIQPDSVASIWEISDIEWQPHLVKKNIIQHSIYGVDLESGAVDIARLRFWLALVVDEIEPLPLPNLDYKIMQGNSLLESFEGIDLSQISHASAYEEVYETEQIDMFSGEAKKSVSISLSFEDIKSLMDDYFNANDPDTKKEIHKKIDDQVLNHIRFTLLQHKQSLLTKKTPLERKLKLDEASASTWQQKEKIRTSSKQAKELAKINADLDLFNEKEIKLAQLSNSNERPFFLWHLFFKEVFDKGGFDVVIGNPPYIKEYTNKDVFKGLHSSPYYQGKMDIWYLFGSFCLDLLKPNGVECFIAQNNWITSAGASKFRNKLLNEAEIKIFTDFGNYKVFNSAGIQTMIYLLKKNKMSNVYNTNYILLKNDSISQNNLKYVLDKNHTLVYADKYIFSFDSKKYIDNVISFNTSDLNDILNKIQSEGNFKLTEKEVIQGIVGAPDKAFVINENILQKFNEDEKKYVKKYYTNASGISDDFIIYLCDKHFKSEDINKYPNLFEHFKPFRKKLEESKIKFKTPNKQYYFLHRERDEKFFIKGEKIICQIRSKTPCFYYTTEEYYVSRAANVIKSNRINMKYLSAILNSNLIYFYYKNRGASQGNILKFDKGPLLNIPIKLHNNLKIFDELIHDSSINSELNKTEIDKIIYKIYNLSFAEVLVIDPYFKIKKEEYESIN